MHSHLKTRLLEFTLKAGINVLKINLKSPIGKVMDADVHFDGESDISFITQSLTQEVHVLNSGDKVPAFYGFGAKRLGSSTKRKPSR